MIAIPLPNKPFETISEVPNGALIELLPFGVSKEVKGDFEFKVVLDHV